MTNLPNQEDWISKPKEVHTLWLEQPGEEPRQYGFHLGTYRREALMFGEERALWHIRHGAISASLRQGDKVVKIWDCRDLADWQGPRT